MRIDERTIRESDEGALHLLDIGKGRRRGRERTHLMMILGRDLSRASIFMIFFYYCDEKGQGCLPGIIGDLLDSI